MRGRDERLTSVLAILPLSIKLSTYGGWQWVKAGTQSWHSGTHLCFGTELLFFPACPLSPGAAHAVGSDQLLNRCVISLKGALAAENLRKLGWFFRQWGMVHALWSLRQKLPLSHDFG